VKQRNVNKRLDQRRAVYDATKEKGGLKRPGSLRRR
jgi:hypothetical protein